jgi:hypothetical protein
MRASWTVGPLSGRVPADLQKGNSTHSLPDNLENYRIAVSR